MNTKTEKIKDLYQFMINLVDKHPMEHETAESRKKQLEEMVRYINKHGLEPS